MLKVRICINAKDYAKWHEYTETVRAWRDYLPRFFPLPQLYLGLCFGWAVPMAFAATLGTVPRVGWLMLVAAILWAGVYDTMYAMVDRDDDLRIGVRSSAIVFADLDRFMIAVMQLMTLFALLSEHRDGIEALARLLGVELSRLSPLSGNA